MFPGLDLYCTNPAQHPMTAGEDLDDLCDLDRDLSNVCNVRRRLRPPVGFLFTEALLSLNGYVFLAARIRTCCWLWLVLRKFKIFGRRWKAHHEREKQGKGDPPCRPGWSDSFALGHGATLLYELYAACLNCRCCMRCVSCMDCVR